MPEPVAGVPSRFLAFDFGIRRIGVACGSGLTGLAQLLKTIAAEGQARWDAITRVVREWEPDALVIGVPFHPDGQAHENTDRARRFGRQLHGRLGLPVMEVDERYSTTEALAEGARDADAGAAVIILEQYLRSQVNPHATST